MIGFTLPEIRRLLTKLVLRVTDAAEHTTSPLSLDAGVGRVLERPLRVGWLVEPGFCPVDPRSPPPCKPPPRRCRVPA